MQRPKDGHANLNVKPGAKWCAELLFIYLFFFFVARTVLKKVQLEQYHVYLTRNNI